MASVLRLSGKLLGRFAHDKDDGGTDLADLVVGRKRQLAVANFFLCSYFLSNFSNQSPIPLFSLRSWSIRTPSCTVGPSALRLFHLELSSFLKRLSLRDDGLSYISNLFCFTNEQMKGLGLARRRNGAEQQQKAHNWPLASPKYATSARRLRCKIRTDRYHLL